MTDDEFSRWIASATKAKARSAHGAAALCADAIRLLTQGIKTNGQAELETQVAIALRDLLCLPAGDYEGQVDVWRAIQEAAEEGADAVERLTREEETEELPRDTRDWRDV